VKVVVCLRLYLELLLCTARLPVMALVFA